MQAPILPWRVMQRHGVNPDIVFIDGRFRVASFLATYLNASKPCTVVFDNYRDRECYHVVESILKPSRFIDRTAFLSFSLWRELPRLKVFWRFFLLI